jgi:hypothetical protein
MARCEGFNTEPGVHYHAHDLPPCPEEAVVGWGNPARWVCQRHFEERLSGARRVVEQAQAAWAKHVAAPGSPEWEAECEEFGCHGT